MFILEFYRLKVNSLFWMVVVWLLVYLASWQRHQLVSGSHLSRFDLKATELRRFGPYCVSHRPCGKLGSESFFLCLLLCNFYILILFLFSLLFSRGDTSQWMGHCDSEGAADWHCDSASLSHCQMLWCVQIWEHKKNQWESWMDKEVPWLHSKWDI